MDARDRAAMNGGDKGKIVFPEWDDDDCEIEHELPTKFEVCSLCQGKGTHVNPSIDANGLSSEDFYDDPDFAEDYLSGVYEQTCNNCHGKRVESVVDEDRCDPEILKKYYDYLEGEAEHQRESDWERRMGC